MSKRWFSSDLLFRDFMEAYRMRLVMEGHASSLRAHLKELKKRKKETLDPRSVFMLHEKWKIRDEIKKTKKSRKEVKVQIKDLTDVMHELIESMKTLGSKVATECILEQSTEAERERLAEEFPQLFAGLNFINDENILESKPATVFKLNKHLSGWRQIGIGTIQIRQCIGSGNTPTTWSILFIYVDEDTNEKSCELQITKFLQTFRLRTADQTFLKGFSPDMGANGLENIVDNYFRCDFQTHEECVGFATTLYRLISDLRVPRMGQETDGNLVDMPQNIRGIRAGIPFHAAF